MKNLFKYLIIPLYLLIAMDQSRAQEKLQVVTKLIENSFPYETGNKLTINGEKAEITIVPWERSTMSVQIKLISKQARKDIAEKDLGLMKYVLEKSKGTIYIRNYVTIPEKAKVESILKAEIYIRVPSGKINAKVSDNFGKVDIRNIEGVIHIDSRYSDLSLSHLEGQLSMITYFGDIYIDGFDGILKLKSDYSKVQGGSLKGNIKAEVFNSDISITDSSLEGKNEITGQNAVINLTGFLPASYNFALTCSEGEIEAPLSIRDKIKGGSKKTFTNSNEPNKPSIIINNILGNIILK